MKFRKKPIIIDAEQFKLGQPSPKGVVPVYVDRMDEALVLGPVEGDEDLFSQRGNLAFGIKTLEGWYVVTNGDWIITGIKGERYPCKPDIFEQTYERVV